MSLLSGIVTLPSVVCFAFRVYRETSYESPVPCIAEVTNLQAVNSGRDNRDIGTEEMRDFLDKAGVRKDVLFLTQPNSSYCCAKGTNFFTKKGAAVLIAPGFFEADKGACLWAIKHEISHIKHNDVFMLCVVSSICQLAAAIFGMCCLPFLPAVILVWWVGAIAFSLFSKWREAKADDFAIANSSIEELKGGRRCLKALQASNVERRKAGDFWQRMLISPKGEARLDIAHPLLASRIRKIEQALSKQGVGSCTLSVEEEESKIKQLTTHVTKDHQAMKAAAKELDIFGWVKQMATS